VGTGPCHPLRPRTSPPGAAAHPERGHLGQPERQDHRAGGPHGYDGAKRLNGRKRHLLVDTLGLVCKVQVTAADVGDRDGAAQLLRRLDRRRFPRLRHGWVDGGYRGPFLDWAHQRRGISFQVVSRSDGGRKPRWLPPGATPPIVSPFAVVPRRWVVERTFAWLGRFRRLSKDYEFLTATSEAVIYLAMTRLLLRRLTAHEPFSDTL
jgi:putative transposase